MEKKGPLEEIHLPLADHHILGEREREKNFDQKKILEPREISDQKKILEQKKISEQRKNLEPKKVSETTHRENHLENKS